MVISNLGPDLVILGAFLMQIIHGEKIGLRSISDGLKGRNACDKAEKPNGKRRAQNHSTQSENRAPRAPWPGLVLPNVRQLPQRKERDFEDNTLRGGTLNNKTGMGEMSIERRLENWGYCQRGKGGGSMRTAETRRISPYGGQGYRCMTNVVCTLMREAASGPKGGATTQAKLDFDDAAKINLAWMQLGPRHKLLLRDFYALERAVNVICREMDIKHWPASHWKRELASAHAAIQKIIDSQNCSA